MKDHIKKFLTQNWKTIVEELDVSLIQDVLIQEGAIKPEKMKEITQQPTEQAQARMLLSTLLKRDQSVYEIFRNSLKADQKHLYNMLVLGEQGGVTEEFDHARPFVDEQDKINPETVDISAAKISHHPEMRVWRKKIAEHCLRTRSKISLLLWNADNRFVPIDDVYTDLSWLENVSRTDQSHKRSLAHHLQMFVEVNGLLPKRILAQGRAGTGKTTVVSKLAVDWSRGVIGYKPKEQQPMASWLRELMDYVKSFDIMLPIKLREVTSGMTLADVISTQIPHLSGHTAGLCQYIRENEDRVLFLFDGYDEYDSNLSIEVTQIIHNQTLLGSCVVMTTRPWKATEIPNPEYIDAHVEVVGFARVNICHYVAKFFQNRKDAYIIRDKLIKKIDDQSLWALASIPLILQLMCILFSEQESLPETLSELYTEIVLYIINSFRAKESQSSPKGKTPRCTIADFEEELLQLGELAYEGLISSESGLLFDYAECKKKLSECAWKLGFLTRIGSDSLHVSAHVEFPHKSVQEFLAAFYIARCRSEKAVEIFKERCCTIEDVYNMQLVILFVCGLNPTCGNEVLSHVTKVAEQNSQICRDQEKPGPVQTGSFQPSYFKYAQRFTNFMTSCTREFTNEADFSVPLKELVTWIHQDNADLISNLLQNKIVVQNLKLLCLCALNIKLNNKEENKLTNADNQESLKKTESDGALEIRKVKNSSYENGGLETEENMLHLNTHDSLQVPSAKPVICKMCPIIVRTCMQHVASLHLHTFCLAFIDCSSGIQELMVQISRMRNLKSLCIVEAGLGEKHMEVIFGQLLTLVKLEYLNFSGNFIRNSIKKLMMSLYCLDKLKGLVLIRAGLNVELVKDLAANVALYCKELEILDLSRNLVGDSVENICKEFKNLPNLYRLKLQDCAISSSGLKSIVHHLPETETLKELYLSWNKFDDDIKFLPSAASNFAKMHKLHLLAHDLSDQLVQQIEASMKEHAPNMKLCISQSLERQTRKFRHLVSVPAISTDLKNEELVIERCVCRRCSLHQIKSLSSYPKFDKVPEMSPERRFSTCPPVCKLRSYHSDCQIEKLLSTDLN